MVRANKPHYRIPQAYRNECNRQINKLLEDDIIEPSDSPYNSPFILVPKEQLKGEEKKLFAYVSISVTLTLKWYLCHIHCHGLIISCMNLGTKGTSLHLIWRKDTTKCLSIRRIGVKLHSVSCTSTCSLVLKLLLHFSSLC